MDTSAVTDRTLQGMARVRRNPAAAATIDLRLIVSASAVQLDPTHEADARFFESDRGCWKAGLRSAGLTNACGRRPSAPLRKVIESPVQCGGQAGCRVFLRHISIMRLLSLGYEPYDVRLPRPGRSPVAALTLANGCRASRPNLGVSRAAPHPAASRARIRAPICLLTRGIAVWVTGSVSGLLRDLAHVRQASSPGVRCYPGVAVITLSRPPHRARGGHVGASTPAVDRDLVAEAPRTVGRADEIDLRQRGRPFLLRLPESADGGNP